MKKLIFSVAILTLVFSCQKKVDELPPATQTGANTFGVKVNGELWVPSSSILPGASKLEARYLPNHGLIINARNLASSPTESEFEIYLQNLDGTGTYQLNSSTALYPSMSASYAYYVLRKINPINEWMTSPQYTGVVNITLNDTINHIVSGTFEFTALNQSGPADVLHVTEGRFDVKPTF